MMWHQYVWNTSKGKSKGSSHIVWEMFNATFLNPSQLNRIDAWDPIPVEKIEVPPLPYNYTPHNELRRV